MEKHRWFPILLFTGTMGFLGSFAEASSCQVRAQSFYKQQMEKLLNQQYRGQIDGREFEAQRAEIQYVYEGETSICLSAQELSDGVPQGASIFDPPPARALASPEPENDPHGAFNDAGYLQN